MSSKSKPAVTRSAVVRLNTGAGVYAGTMEEAYDVLDRIEAVSSPVPVCVVLASIRDAADAGGDEQTAAIASVLLTMANARTESRIISEAMARWAEEDRHE